MKKFIFILIISGLIFALPSCKRNELNDPPFDGPAGYKVLLEGWANPAVLLIDGYPVSSQINVRVTDYKGAPLAHKKIFFEQLIDPTSNVQLDWGYFGNNQKTIIKVTDANGLTTAKFFGPLELISSNMYIHVLMVIDDRTDGLVNIPQDYIELRMVYSGKSSPKGR
jgi:hypothetical protein